MTVDVYTPDNPPPPGVAFVMEIPLPDPPDTDKTILPKERDILERKFADALAVASLRTGSGERENNE